MWPWDRGRTLFGMENVPSTSILPRLGFWHDQGMIQHLCSYPSEAWSSPSPFVKDGCNLVHYVRTFWNQLCTTIQQQAIFPRGKNNPSKKRESSRCALNARRSATQNTVNAIAGNVLQWHLEVVRNGRGGAGLRPEQGEWRKRDRKRAMQRLLGPTICIEEEYARSVASLPGLRYLSGTHMVCQNKSLYVLACLSAIGTKRNLFCFHSSNFPQSVLLLQKPSRIQTLWK